jgi:hypothetical protein
MTDREHSSEMTHYAERHANKTNLVIHLIAVPVFILAHIGLVSSLLSKHWLGVGVNLMMILLSLAMQGKGHRLEQTPPDPFASPMDFVKRIYREQFWVFPRFMLASKSNENK